MLKLPIENPAGGGGGVSVGVSGGGGVNSGGRICGGVIGGVAGGGEKGGIMGGVTGGGVIGGVVPGGVIGGVVGVVPGGFTLVPSSKVAVTRCGSLIVTEHVPLPEQSPDQNLNIHPGCASGCRLTVVPAGYSSVQSFPHKMFVAPISPNPAL
jgi:hypothetical protein